MQRMKYIHCRFFFFIVHSFEGQLAEGILQGIFSRDLVRHKLPLVCSEHFARVRHAYFCIHFL